MKKAVEDPLGEHDRSVYETWGGRAIDAYDTVKTLYSLLTKGKY